jgi:hypothetical protein
MSNKEGGFRRNQQPGIAPNRSLTGGWIATSASPLVVSGILCDPQPAGTPRPVLFERLNPLDPSIINTPSDPI